jgi:HK97 family phage prohead protease
MTQRMITGGRPSKQILRASLQLTDVGTTDSFSMMEGRAAPYGEWGNRGWYLEAFADGLFEKSIKEASAALPLLIFHDDLTWPIGSAVKWTSQSDGLYGQWRLDGSSEAQRAAQLAKDGHMTSMSVGYQPQLSKWDWSDLETWDPDDASTLDRVTRVEARLLETSLVPLPLLAGAQVTLVASGESTHRQRRHADTRPKLAAWQRLRSTL